MSSTTHTAPFVHIEETEIGSTIYWLSKPTEVENVMTQGIEFVDHDLIILHWCRATENPRARFYDKKSFNDKKFRPATPRKWFLAEAPQTWSGTAQKCWLDWLNRL